MLLISTIRLLLEENGGINFLKSPIGPILYYLGIAGTLRIKTFEYLNLNHCDLFEIWGL